MFSFVQVYNNIRTMTVCKTFCLDLKRKLCLLSVTLQTVTLTAFSTSWTKHKILILFFEGVYKLWSQFFQTPARIQNLIHTIARLKCASVTSIRLQHAEYHMHRDRESTRGPVWDSANWFKIREQNDVLSFLSERYLPKNKWIS